MRYAICSILIALGWSATAQATETVTYTYDARGRIVTVVHSGTVNSGITTSYTTDAADNRTIVTTTGASH